MKDIIIEVEFYDSPCEYEHGITMSNARLDLIKDAEEVVITKPCITVLVDYPLKDGFMFPLYANSDSFTRKDLVHKVLKLYEWIYKTESRTSNIKEGSHPYFDFNRNTTDGYFGIFGHSLDDLILHTVTYDATRDIYFLGIDS